MTGDKVEKDSMAFGHLSDLEMAGKVRMLMRGDLGHEAVCVGSRDRIMYLSQEVDRLTAVLQWIALAPVADRSIAGEMKRKAAEAVRP